MNRYGRASKSRAPALSPGFASHGVEVETSDSTSEAPARGRVSLLAALSSIAGEAFGFEARRVWAEHDGSIDYSPRASQFFSDPR